MPDAHLGKKLGIERMQIQEPRTELTGRVFAILPSRIARRRRWLREEIIESPLRIPVHPRPLPPSATTSAAAAAAIETIILLPIRPSKLHILTSNS